MRQGCKVLSGEQGFSTGQVFSHSSLILVSLHQLRIFLQQEEEEEGEDKEKGGDGEGEGVEIEVLTSSSSSSSPESAESDCLSVCTRESQGSESGADSRVWFSHYLTPAAGQCTPAGSATLPGWLAGRTPTDHSSPVVVGGVAVGGKWTDVHGQQPHPPLL